MNLVVLLLQVTIKVKGDYNRGNLWYWSGYLVEWGGMGEIKWAKTEAERGVQPMKSRGALT